MFFFVNPFLVQSKKRHCRTERNYQLVECRSLHSFFSLFFKFSLSLQMSHILVEQAVASSQYSELKCLYLSERALGNIPRHRHTLAVLDRLDTVTLAKLAFIQLSLLFCCYLGQQQPLSPLPFNQLSLYLRLRFCYTHTLRIFVVRLCRGRAE